MKIKVCPNCKKSDCLYAEVKVFAQLIQPADENIEMFSDIDETISFSDITENTNVKCNFCNWSGEVGQLEEKLHLENE
jgi:hypothetical protein